MSTDTYLIYKLTCSISGKGYIGQTKDLLKRTQAHLRKKSSCRVLARAIKKYGWNTFTTEVLACNLVIEQANNLEAEYIVLHKTLAPNGYNLRAGGDNSVMSEETKKRMSQSRKGKPARNKGVPLSEEHKAKLRAAKANVSIETRQKLSAGKRGSNNPNYGKPGTMLGRKRTGERGPARPAR